MKNELITGEMNRNIHNDSAEQQSGEQAFAFEIIAGLRKSWQHSRMISTALLAVSIGMPLVVFLCVVFNTNFLWVIPVIMILFTLLHFIFNRSPVRNENAARLLNAKYARLEESSQLILKPHQQLGFLEKLQVRKISGVMRDLYNGDANFRRENPGSARLRKAAGLCSLSLLLAVAIYFTGPYLRTAGNRQGITAAKDINERPEKILPAITAVDVAITPPAYTAVRIRSQQRFNIRAEEGSKLTWQLQTKGNPTSVQLIFNDSSVTNLESLNREPRTWAAEKRLLANGFYQVKVDDILSEFYQLEIIPDKQPTIVVQSPRPSTIIEYGQAPKFALSLGVSDDYGVSSANIFATIASGNGEAVKFREQKLSFSDFVAGSKQLKLNRAFNLPSMGMQPGDELYFYISAIDNNKQETRSDIFTVKLEDTASLLSMDGMMSGVDVKPEFFRSQRQIIIETEQLLKVRDTMTKEAFNNRCNDLGIDQKLLRLRYGKFLGEESETNIGEEGNTGHAHEGEKHSEGDEHDDDHDEEIAAEDFNNAEKIIDRYAHKHDIAEDATFFDPQTKKELKAVLAEMWDAELRLRTYKPAEALPYEYKALRLLKDLQQKSREYVAKTNTKTTPLKPEKRLTGELDKIINAANAQSYKAVPDKEMLLRNALAKLDELQDSAKQELLKNNGRPAQTSLKIVLSENAEEVIERTTGEVSLRAGADPALYLPAFQALQRILKNQGSVADLNTASKALQRIIGNSARLPVNRQSSPDIKLSKEYFKNLNKSPRGT